MKNSSKNKLRSFQNLCNVCSEFILSVKILKEILNEKSEINKRV